MGEMRSEYFYRAPFHRKDGGKRFDKYHYLGLFQIKEKRQRSASKEAIHSRKDEAGWYCSCKIIRFYELCRLGPSGPRESGH